MSSQPILSAPYGFSRSVNVHGQAADSDYVEARSMLRRALQMPSQHRWIADWLFSDADSSFHCNIVIPPESFDKSLAIHVHRSRLSPPPRGAVPTLSRFLHGMRPNSWSSLQHAEHMSPIDTDMLYVPVAKIENFSVGYCFIVGMTGPSTDAMDPAEFYGRFAFDSSDNDLLMVFNGLPTPHDASHSNVMSMMSAKLSADGIREYRALACPRDTYSFEKLPSCVLSTSNSRSGSHVRPAYPPPTSSSTGRYTSVSHSEHVSYDRPYGREGYSSIHARMLGHCGTQHQIVHGEMGETENQHQDGTCDHDAWSAEDGRFAGQTVTSRMPWIVDDGGIASDGVRISRCPGRSGTSSGAFHGEALDRSVSGLELLLTGKVRYFRYGKNFRNAGLKGTCTEDPSVLNAKLGVADDSLADAMRRMAYHAYFSTVLRIQTDRQLVITPVAEGSSDDDIDDAEESD